MQTILFLGNALNRGTARGAAVGFKLNTLPRLSDTKINDMHTRGKKMTFVHYLCKVLADKVPELLDFSKELGSLEPASKIQLKILAEEMQAITKGLEKVVQEKELCKKDGRVSKRFRKKYFILGTNDRSYRIWAPHDITFNPTLLQFCFRYHRSLLHQPPSIQSLLMIWYLFKIRCTICCKPKIALHFLV
ncbi:hypothetical protein L2E82_14861 [Cichorium intybus]|uniref:Uncharacterized protein n=1 Tax=Cichorium intybus TaxID=13427 RepID=A0ACB9F0M3_CICIN|nr:hypothetical protein L2E82_14861 [Cichorium intybus]